MHRKCFVDDMNMTQNLSQLLQASDLSSAGGTIHERQMLICQYYINKLAVCTVLVQELVRKKSSASTPLFAMYTTQPYWLVIRFSIADLRSLIFCLVISPGVI